MKTIQNRTELLFLYETENNNPNGDPLNENRPRFDVEDGRVLVSDVRLKRTIRDYWFEYKGYDGTDGKDIFVRETTYKEGDKTYVTSGKRRAEPFKETKETVLETCLDVRVFGGVLPSKAETYTFTGPVQFQMGKSLNQTTIVTEQGTGAFASGDKKAQATFRTEYKVPYALIGFNGIINEKAATYTLMTEEDKALLLEGIWEGTKNLISRSKFGQLPLLLLAIDYKEPYYIGSLRQRLALITQKAEEQIRSVADYKIDLTALMEVLKENKDKIAHVSIKTDKRCQFELAGAPVSFENGELKID